MFVALDSLLTVDMMIRPESELGDWRRRVPQGTRDIAMALVITVLALGVISLTWLRSTAHRGHEPVATISEHDLR